MNASNGITIKYRRGTKDDLPKIFEFIQELAAMEKRPEAVTNTLELMNQEHTHFDTLVATNGSDHVIGAVIYFFEYSTYVGKSLHLEDIIVDRTYRGQGIGSELMKRIIEFAKKSNCKRIRWTMIGWNEPAKKFYRKHGARIEDQFSLCSIDF